MYQYDPYTTEEMREAEENCIEVENPQAFQYSSENRKIVLMASRPRARRNDPNWENFEFPLRKSAWICDEREILNLAEQILLDHNPTIEGQILSTLRKILSEVKDQHKHDQKKK